MRKDKKEFLIPGVLSGFSGILLALSFPLPQGRAITILGWFALLPFLLALKNSSPKRAFFLGLISGIVAYLGILYWIPYCMITYANMPRVIAYFALFLLVLILAGYLGIFSWLLRILALKRNFNLLIFGPLLWVAIEYLRTYFPLGGFPWALLGNSQYKFIHIIQISDLAGVWLVSWLVALVNFSIAGLLEKIPPTKKALRELGFGFACFWLALIYGEVRIKQVERAFQDKPEIRVGIVQGNIDQGVKWSPDYFWAGIYRHKALSQSLLKEPKELLIWPESVVTSFFNQHWQERDEVVDVLSDFNAYLLFGSIAREVKNDKRFYYNSAYLLSPNGKELIGRYDKIHLVPFGEYIPMRRLLFWVDAIAGGNTGASSPGREIKVFETPGFKIACVICYELIFPNLVRKFVKQGAEIMSTITNDAWFGKTSAPYQHNSQMVFRAVENRVYFLRSANTGISSISDPVGRILAQTEIYEVGELSGVVRPSSISTLYTKYGDWFPILCLGLTILAVMFSLKGGKDKGSKEVRDDRE